MDFRPKDATFKKSQDSKNHLKPLYIRGHLSGRLVSRMLVDGGAIINAMPYATFKSLGGCDDELVKMNITINGVGGGDPIGAKGVASMELTVGSKALATAFFIADIPGNYSVILGRDWIHENHCVPSLYNSS